MIRSEINEFHFITPISNLSSILEHGILSNQLASKIRHETVALEEVQERRDKKSVPGGLRLHHYANVYFDARNPMMYKRRLMHEQLCVISVNDSVLDLPDVVVSDCNAARDSARFY